MYIFVHAYLGGAPEKVVDQEKIYIKISADCWFPKYEANLYPENNT